MMGRHPLIIGHQASSRSRPVTDRLAAAVFERDLGSPAAERSPDTGTGVGRRREDNRLRRGPSHGRMCGATAKPADLFSLPMNRLANDFTREAAALGPHVIYTQQVLDWDALSDRQRRWETGLCAVGSWGAESYVDPRPGLGHRGHASVRLLAKY